MSGFHAFRFTAVLLVATSTRVAAADDIAACVGSYEVGQQHRKEGRLLEAQRDFALCSREVCPEVARRDCVVWFREIEASVPSIVVRARTASGLDVIDGEVRVDDRATDQARPPRLTGTPHLVDPGSHKVSLLLPDGRIVELPILVNVGEKNRFVTLTVPDAAVAPHPVAPLQTTKATVAKRSALPWIVGGLGVAAVVVGGTLDILGSGDVRRLRSRCAPSCDTSDVDSARVTIIAGDSLIAGGLIAVGAAVFLALRNPDSATKTVTGSPGSALEGEIVVW